LHNSEKSSIFAANFKLIDKNGLAQGTDFGYGRRE
jgi:hypothetical protein